MESVVEEGKGSSVAESAAREAARPDGPHSAGQHTPGPWAYVPGNEHHGPYVTSDFGNTIADCYFMSRPTPWSSEEPRPVCHMHEMAEANARLIASAPRLLEALRQLHWKTVIGTDQERHDALNEAWDAIYEAEAH